MAASHHLINKCDQKIRQLKNQIIKHQIRRKINATILVKFLPSFFKWLGVGVCCTWRAPSPERFTASL